MRKHGLLALVTAGALIGLPATSSQAHVTATAAAKLHAGEFCSKSKQRYYHRHGYTCRRASDGRNRLYTY